TEDRTATAQVVKSMTRIMVGDRYKLVGHSAPLARPIEPAQISSVKNVATAIPSDLVARTLQVQDATGQSRLNLGDLKNLLRYDSGEAAIRPEGYKVLDQLIEYLRSGSDARMVRVEGHADNVEIGPSLKSRYPSNWELSKARAGGVVRYLVEKGGLDSARLSSIGYGDSRPAATNANEEGRTSNRRVEVVLYSPASTDPKASQPIDPGTAGHVESGASSLSVQGSSSAESASVAAQDGSIAASVSPSLPGKEALPAADGPGILNLPVSTGQAVTESAAQDPVKPAAPPLE
ncbi:MAG TPA: OmpA family protein, partial [Nitrospira sp.]|nr:OmpA family protein [Nitrospira sp.]